MPFSQKEKDFFNTLYKSIDIEPINVEEVYNKDITLSMLRMDKVHPIISGNKIFKLKYYLEQAREMSKKIITFGGAYSNHLVATAAICEEFQIDCIGKVRGERPKILSPSLEYCLSHGMTLEFINRDQYDKEDEELRLNDFKLKNYLLIPSGGSGKEGLRGIGEIKSFYNDNYTHVICPTGTATTIAGISLVSTIECIIGINITKDKQDIYNRISKLISPNKSKKISIINDYNFGGYARSTSDLFLFMNKFYEKTSIPTDFVYTGKMMFGVIDMIKKDFFKSGSKILCLHTGGLQGNLSLPHQKLIF